MEFRCNTFFFDKYTRMRCFTLLNTYFVIILNSNALKFALKDLFSTKQSFTD